MTTEKELLQAVLDRPDDDDPRLAYADWCDQRGTPPPDPRGELIRVQVELARCGKDGPLDTWYPLSVREDQLLARYGEVWAGPLDNRVSHYRFHRGFIALASLSAMEFLQRAPELFRLAPIQHLDLTEVRDVADDLFASPFLRKLRSLSMDRCGIDDKILRELAASPQLKRLQWLSLAQNEITLEGAAALAASEFLKDLLYVNLYGNPADPCERYAEDQGVVVETWLPEDGLALEARYGHIPWLYRDPQTVARRHPDRLTFSPAAVALR